MARSTRCPICESDASMRRVSALPDWYQRRTSLDLYAVRCDTACGTFHVEARRGSRAPIVDEPVVLALEAMTAPERAMFSRHTNTLYHNDCYTILEADTIDRIGEAQRLVQAATRVYRLTGAQIEHAGGFDDENPLYVIDGADARYVLRVNQAGTALDVVRSEVFWLDSLRSDAGVAAIQPASGLTVDPVQRVRLDGSDEWRHVVLYHWVGQGHHLWEHLTPTTIAGFGEATAKMHRHAESFEPPEWFTRPRYGVEYIRELTATAAQACRGGSQLTELREAEAVLVGWMRSKGDAPSVFGLTHSELCSYRGGGNVLVDGDDICPIDFQRFGWGYYLLTVRTALERTLTPSQRPLFIEAYRRLHPLPDDFEQQMDLVGRAWDTVRRWL